MSVARIFQLGLRLAIIGGGSLIVGGVALADSSNVAVDSNGSAPVVAVSSTSTIAKVHQDTTAVKIDGKEAKTTKSDIYNLSANQDTPKQVDGSVTTPPTTTDQSKSEPALIGMEAPTNNAPVAAPGVSNPAQATPSGSSNSSHYSYYSFAQDEPSQVATSSSLPVLPPAVQSTPSSQNNNKPVAPMGAIGSILALFAGATTVRLPDAGRATTTLAMLLLSIVSISGLALLRRFEMSYGAWLKLSGYYALGRSGLPTPFSFFGTPHVLGYASAPAPYA